MVVDAVGRKPKVRRGAAWALGLAFFLVAGLLGPFVAVPAGAVDIVEQVVWGKDSGETWRYTTSDDVGDLGASMADPALDDSTWGTRDLRHFANPGSGRAYYFRKDVEVNDLFKIVGIAVEFQYDDAAVLYLNGTEVYRTIRGNLPTFAEVPVGGDIPADVTVVSGGAENAYMKIPGTNYVGCDANDPSCGGPPIAVAEIPVDLLVEGTNTWAVTLWNRTGSSDVSLDHEFRLVIDRDATALTIEPVSDQTTELATAVSLQLVGDTPNAGPISWSESGLPDGLTLNASTGLITGTPLTQGTSNVVISATDGVRPAQISFDWTIANAPPEVTNPGPQQTASFSPAMLTIEAVDPDGGDLTYAATGLPPGMEINTSTGEITGSSSAEDAYSVEVTVTDDEGASAMVTFSWQIAEPPITIVNPGDQSSQWGVATQLQLSASDPAGGAVTLSINGLPPGLSLNPQTNVVSGTPNEVGAYSVLINGTGPSGQAIVSFEWEIPNVVPLVPPIAAQVGLENIGVSLIIGASDPDGGDVAFAAEGLPPGLVIDGATGEIGGVLSAPGNYSVTVTVTDDEGAESSTVFAWQVFAAIDQPIVINEFVASNTDSLLDEDESSPDWIELRSLAPVALSLEGWVLQDAAASWEFPATMIPAGGYVIVFASDKDRAVAGSELHTNFKLSKESDSLTLIDPGGFVIDEFASETLPQQFTDTSYGRASDGSIFYLQTPTPGEANSPAGSNYTPVLRPFTDRLYNLGEPVNELIDAFDPDGGPMSYSMSPLPPGLQVDITTGAITGTATTSGIFSSQLLVIDVEGKRQEQAVDWIVVGPAPARTRLALNEYNAVAPSALLVAGADPAFGLVEGNGGDWFEFVVVEDGLDLRGWSIELWDRDRGDDLLANSATLVFSDSASLASLPSGMVITVSQDRPDDLTFDPGGGDWHINLQANDDDDGAYFTPDSQENFNSSRANQNVILYNADGELESPALGETELWDELIGGVGSTEVMSLCIDPTLARVDGVNDYLDNGDFSTYGQPNSCTFINDPLDPDDDVRFDQDLSTLRSNAVLVKASVESTCEAENGKFVVQLVNNTSVTVQFATLISGLNPIFRTLASGTSQSQTIVSLDDGVYDVLITANGSAVVSEQVEVSCDALQPPPASTEVAHVSSCLAGNGRIDTNIINPGPGAAVYRIEFQGLTPRENTVLAQDWWRMPITGRPDGNYTIVVRRDGVEVSNTSVTVSCDTAPPQVDALEVQMVNACRAGNGYILFQFVNSTAAQRGWVVEFEGVANRSTSAAPYAQSVRAVTGRPDGTYTATIRADGEPITSFPVTVNCSVG